MLTEQAPAKINLSLDVLRRRPDGYHDLLMVMQTISLMDTLTLDALPGSELVLTSNEPALPLGAHNLAFQAVTLFYEKIGRDRPGLKIHIDKQIPMGAGLGGGSADAAATLRLLNRWENAELSEDALCQMAEVLGSDVPFCVGGGTRLAGGRGEKLLNLPPLPDCFVVVCQPDFSLSTKEVFAHFDFQTASHSESGRQTDCTACCPAPRTEALLLALIAGDVSGVAASLGNRLFAFLPHGKEVIGRLCTQLRDGGALGATMTGSGSAAFGLFDSEACAQNTVKRLQAQGVRVWLAQPVSNSLTN